MTNHSPKFRQRHIAALNILGYAIILADSRMTAGTVGFMLGNYGRGFLLFLAAWGFAGTLWLLLRRSSGIAIFLSALPIFAYAVMGAAFYFLVDNAPIAALILPSIGLMNILYFVKSRIEDTARNISLDDTFLPPVTGAPYDAKPPRPNSDG